MTVERLRIRNKAAFVVPEFADFMLQFFESNRMVKKPGAALLEVVENVHKESMGLFVTRNEKGLTGAVLCQLSTSHLNPACVIIHLYCKGGGAETRNELIQAMHEFATEGGYNEIIAIDANNKPVGFAKVFSGLGKPKKIGSVFRFDLQESLL